MTDTDSGKRLSDAEIAEMRAFAKSLDGNYWINIDKDRLLKNHLALLSHIASLTTNRGNVSDVAHNIISYCREHRSNTDVLIYTREEAMEYVTAAIQQAVSKSSAPQNGEVGELVKALRAASAILTKHPCEVVYLARDCARAADALTRLSQPSTPSGEAVRGIEERDEALRWVKAMERQGEDYIWRGAKKTREFIEALSQSPPHACCEGLREKAAKVADTMAKYHVMGSAQSGWDSACVNIAYNIRALPLPVSADGRDDTPEAFGVQPRSHRLSQQPYDKEGGE